MGLLTDDDLHQLLYLIDPETFDESYVAGEYILTVLQQATCTLGHLIFVDSDWACS